MKSHPYPIEDIRTFAVKRSWFMNHRLGQDVYESLKDRTLALRKEEADYWRAFIEGYLAAKN